MSTAWKILPMRKAPKAQPKPPNHEREGTSDIHILKVWQDGDDSLYDWWHPESCPVSLDYTPRTVSTSGQVLHPGGHSHSYHCAVSAHLNECGIDADLAPGLYEVEYWWYVSGYESPEYDAGLDITPLIRPDRS